MPFFALIVGIILIITGIIQLPSPPATPEQIHASQAMPLFFFGGAYVICGLFSRTNPKHGRSGIFLVSFLGVSMALAAFLRGAEHSQSPAQLIMFGLSLPILVSSFVLWRRSRRFVPTGD